MSPKDKDAFFKPDDFKGNCAVSDPVQRNLIADVANAKLQAARAAQSPENHPFKGPHVMVHKDYLKQLQEQAAEGDVVMVPRETWEKALEDLRLIVETPPITAVEKRMGKVAFDVLMNLKTKSIKAAEGK